MLSKKSKNIIYSIIGSLVMVAVCVGGELLLTQTSSYELDYFSYRLANEGKKADKDGSDDVLISINYKEDYESSSKYYNDIFQEYYYNSAAQAVFQVNNTNYSLSDTGEKFTLLYQSTFSIKTTKEESGYYYLDFGVFYTYFTYYTSEEDASEDAILSRSEMLGPRNGADSGILITDSYADQLIEKYGLEEKDYASLILNDEYNLIELYCENYEVRLSINNILNTSIRKGEYAVSLYGNNFGLVFPRGVLATDATYRIDIIPTESEFMINDVLDTINAYGYNVDNCDFTFNIKDENGDYIINEGFTNSYASIDFDSNNAVWYAITYSLYIIAAILLMYVLFVSLKIKKKLKKYLSITTLSVFFVYLLIDYFRYVFYMSSIGPVAIFIIALIYVGKEVIYDKFSKKRKADTSSEDEKLPEYVEINI